MKPACGWLLLAAAFLVAGARPAAALDFCPAAGKVELPSRPAGGGAPDPCEGLRVLAKVTAACAGEYPDDRALQAHAAGILELEGKARIDASVLASLRKMRAAPERMQGMKIDPAALERQIQMGETLASQHAGELAARRQSAAAAGYPLLAQEGYAQTIVTNAVWRYLDGEVRSHPADCTTEAGRRAAREFGGMLAVAASHGNPFEREVMRRLLESR